MNLLTSSSSLFGSNGELTRAQKAHRENERSNLTTVTRLVIRSVLDHSMKALNRIIEGDSTQLSDFLILLEKVLFHGLKTSDQRSLLSFRSPDADLWIAIGRCVKFEQSHVRVDPEDPSCRGYVCVEQLEYLKTSISKIRALLRLSLMQKRLADLFQNIVKSSALSECWNSWAILRSSEAEPILGSLIGLSVLNCNLHIDFEHLQEQPLTVDLSQYIKIPTVPTEGHEEKFEEKIDEETKREMKTLLDQNHYLEERNRMIEDKILGMRTKIENDSVSSLDMESISFRRLSAESAEKEVQMWKDREKLWDQEKNRLMGMLVEKEDTIRLAEQQIKDLTQLNKDIYEKLKMAEAAEKKLENDFTTLRQKHHQEKESLRKTMSGLLNQADNEKDLQNELNVLSDKFSTSLSDLDEKQQELRELRKELDATKVDKERYEKDAKLLPSLKQEVITLREKLDAAEEKNAELEAALEEIGPQLSRSKLKILELREETLPMTGEWQKDGEVTECNACQSMFTLAKRKHHCRACGRIFCSTCSSGRIRLPSSSQPVRVCSACFHHLQLVYDPTESRQS